MRRDYLPDVQPVLWQVAVETCTTFDEMQGQTVETFRSLHGPLGLLAQQDAASAWDWPLTDGLGSVRAVLDDAGSPLHALHYAPYGEPFDGTGTPQMPHGFTGEPTDGNGLVYLRARYYVPGLGVFPSLDPVEDGNRYAYVAGNPINRTDASGQCWNNKASTSLQREVCGRAWEKYILGIVVPKYGKPGQWGDAIEQAFRTEHTYWSELSYDEFMTQWNDPAIAPSRPPNQASSLVLVAGTVSVANPFLGPEDLFALGLLCVAGIVATVATSAITMPARPYEYRLTGLDAKVGTLAEHLAKLLEYDVAGYPPSDPNPNRDPDGGWCRTIRRVIQEIDSSGYSQKQLNRDLEIAGFGENRWLEIVNAVKEVVRLGLCEDHWGDFGGGSLAAGG